MKLKYRHNAQMLYRMIFHLSGKIVALHLDKSTVKAYLCKQCCTISIFRLTYHSLNLYVKQCLNLIPTYRPTNLKVGVDYLSLWRLVTECHFCPHVAQVAFPLWSQIEVDLLESSHSSQCQHYYTLETSNSRSLRVEQCQPSLAV